MFYVYNLSFFIYLCAVLTNNEQYKKSNNNANMEQPFNLVSNATLKKNVADYTLIVIGAFLQALSYVLFLAPYKIVPGFSLLCPKDCRWVRLLFVLMCLCCFWP